MQIIFPLFILLSGCALIPKTPMGRPQSTRFSEASCEDLTISSFEGNPEHAVENRKLDPLGLTQKNRSKFLWSLSINPTCSDAKRSLDLKIYTLRKEKMGFTGVLRASLGILSLGLIPIGDDAEVISVLVDKNTHEKIATLRQSASIRYGLLSFFSSNLPTSDLEANEVIGITIAADFLKSSKKAKTQEGKE